MRTIGLMSGTSVDAVDGIVLRMDGHGAPLATEATATIDLPLALRDAIHALQRTGPDELTRAAHVANELADIYAECVNALLRAASLQPGDVDAIGAHGQTVRHRPEQGYTLQLLNGARLAEQTKIDVVCDLRSADVAAHGQGAPLLPAFHAQVFSEPLRNGHAILNLGGISNVTLLQRDGTLLGFDCGPANTLLDQWIHRHRGERFDDAGAWAAGGSVDDALLRRLLDEPYFRQPPPKSSGRDLFDLQWLDEHLRAPEHVQVAPRDVQATLAELCAACITLSLQPHAVRGIVACGGGVRNSNTLERIRRLSGVPVATTSEHGIDPQFVESAGFAWLAMRRIAGLPGNEPTVTGAAGPRILGALWTCH